MDTPTPRREQAGYIVAPDGTQKDIVAPEGVKKGYLKGYVIVDADGNPVFDLEFRGRPKTDGTIKSRGKGGQVKTPTKVVPRRRAPAQARQGLRTAADDPLSLDRVTYLLKTFTSKRLAGWLGVSPSQTSRWSKGKERPGPAVAPALIDLEHVYARARLVWGEEAAQIWLESPNSYLDGARPLDVLYIDGPGRVLESLDAEMWGGAA